LDIAMVRLDCETHPTWSSPVTAMSRTFPLIRTRPATGLVPVGNGEVLAKSATVGKMADGGRREEEH